MGSSESKLAIVPVPAPQQPQRPPAVAPPDQADYLDVIHHSRLPLALEQVIARAMSLAPNPNDLPVRYEFLHAFQQLHVRIDKYLSHLDKETCLANVNFSVHMSIEKL